MILIHGDDKGLVMPPKVAQTQVVIVPIQNNSVDKELFKQKYEEIHNQLKQKGIRVYCDDRDNYSPGWKYNHWELKGVPIRIEIGEKDYQKSEVRVVRRDNGAKE